MQTNRFAMSLLAGVLAWGLGNAVPASAQQSSSPARPASDTPQERQDAKRTTEKSGNAVKDSWVTMKIHSQFVPEDALEDSDIDVDTHNGVVTLTGTVATAQAKMRAVEIAKATDGVKSVRDQLRIGPADVDDVDERAGAAATDTGRDAREKGRELGRDAKDATTGMTKPVTDGWIKSKIYAQYVSENALEDSDINLDVDRGVVTLKGTVASAAGKTRAEQIAKSTDGVKTVKNSLRVSPQG
jgi:hyperosmotically inducible protein